MQLKQHLLFNKILFQFLCEGCTHYLKAINSPWVKQQRNREKLGGGNQWATGIHVLTRQPWEVNKQTQTTSWVWTSVLTMSFGTQMESCSLSKLLQDPEHSLTLSFVVPNFVVSKCHKMRACISHMSWVIAAA